MKCSECGTRITEKDKLPGPGDVYECPNLECEAEIYANSPFDELKE